jgi:hypothetical protein
MQIRTEISTSMPPSIVEAKSARIHRTLTAAHHSTEQAFINHSVFEPNLRLTALEEPSQAERVTERLTAEKELEAYFIELQYLIIGLEVLREEIMKAKYWQLITTFNERKNQFFSRRDLEHSASLFENKIHLSHIQLREFRKKYGTKLKRYLATYQSFRENDAEWMEVTGLNLAETAVRNLQELVVHRIVQWEEWFIESLVDELEFDASFFDQFIAAIRPEINKPDVVNIDSVLAFDNWVLKGTAIAWLQLGREVIQNRMIQAVGSVNRVFIQEQDTAIFSQPALFLFDIATSVARDERYDGPNSVSGNILGDGLRQMYIHLSYCVVQEYVRRNRDAILRATSPENSSRNTALASLSGPDIDAQVSELLADLDF